MATVINGVLIKRKNEVNKDAQRNQETLSGNFFIIGNCIRAYTGNSTGEGSIDYGANDKRSGRNAIAPLYY